MPSGSDLDADLAAAVDASGGDESRVSPAVTVEHLSVSFRTTKEKVRSLSHRLRGRNKTKRTIHALTDVSFEVPVGSVYSVIGTNGAGKSTLFRVIGGIIPPAEGRVVLHSEVTPLLSLGVGFNQRLTGRENILIGGLAAGLEVDQVRERMEAVIEFSELGEAIDYPIRTYSSGMNSRLGFSVAAHLNPDLILIDEALAAGDARFKAKCFDKIEELCAADCTVMLVSHGLSVVKKLADRCLWLSEGRVAMEGETDEVVAAYLDSEHMSETPSTMDDM